MVEAGLAETDLSTDEQEAILEAYEDGQLIALRIGLVVAVGIVIGSLFLARRIPDMSFEEIAAGQVDAIDESGSIGRFGES